MQWTKHARSEPLAIAALLPTRALQLSDAVAVRKRIMSNVEAASVPGLPEEQRRRLLSFVVCGGGPTGIEFCAELHDLLVRPEARRKLPPGS